MATSGKRICASTGERNNWQPCLIDPESCWMTGPQSSVTGKELSGFFWVKVPQFLGCPSPKFRVPKPEQCVVKCCSVSDLTFEGGVKCCYVTDLTFEGVTKLFVFLVSSSRR